MHCEWLSTIVSPLIPPPPPPPRLYLCGTHAPRGNAYTQPPKYFLRHSTPMAALSLYVRVCVCIYGCRLSKPRCGLVRFLGGGGEIDDAPADVSHPARRKAILFPNVSQ